jgi:seryl-tRNA synthetase
MIVHTFAPVSTTDGGLATLGPDLLAVLVALDRCFVSWAGRLGAAQVSFPPLLSVEDLESIDYFENFPHLGIAATPLATGNGTMLGEDDAGHRSLLSQSLGQCRYVLPSAACYNLYFHLRKNTIDRPVLVTTQARCFRNEAEYTGLSRLLAFTMREVICVGDANTVRAFLADAERLLVAFADEIGLPLPVQVATDPFFDPQSPRAEMQRLFAVKKEYLSEGVALASVNYHRNFFGERCQISLEDGSPAFSGCMGMGLERWIHALTGRFGPDSARIVETLEAYSKPDSSDMSESHES